MQGNITEFLHTELYPLLYERLDSVLPEFGFERKNRNWLAMQGPGLDGAPDKGKGHINVPDFAIGFLFDYRTGERISIWDYVQKRDNLSQRETLIYLAQLAGCALPTVPEETLNYWAQKNRIATIWEAANDYMIFCLHDLNYQTPEVNAVRNYIKKRGYQIEDLRVLEQDVNNLKIAERKGNKMELGFLPSVRALREHLAQKGFSEDELKMIHFPILPNKAGQTNDKHLTPGETHCLSLPYRNTFGAIKGFTFRTISSTHNPKYINTEGLDKGLFLLKGKKGQKEFILVEGVLDAALAQARGIENVIALGQAGLSAHHIEELQHWGTQSLIFCFDNDTAGKNATERAVFTVLKYASNLRMYVAHLPAEHKDPDELISQKGITAFQDIIQRAQVYYKFLADNLLTPFEPLAYDKTIDELIDQLATIAEQLPDIDRRAFIEYVLLNSILPEITRETIEQRLRDLITDKEQTRRKKMLADTIQQTRNLYEKGLIDEALQKMQQDWQQIQSLNARHWIQFYDSPTFEQEIKQVSESLSTGIEKLDSMIRLPVGAITIVGARPSHGKTTFLLNLLLNLAINYPNKQFYFFSYEEERKFIALKLLNLLVDTDLQQPQGNLRYLRAYLKGNLPENKIVEKARATLYDLLDSRRINLFEEAFPIQQLVNVIHFLKDRYPVGAILIDYIQKISNPKSFPTRQAELQNTSDQILQQIAKRCGLPVILGAQFNRKALESNESRPQLAHLRESGDIEQDANLVLGLYNYGIAGETHNKDGSPITPESKTVDLEVSVLKNRDGAVGSTFTLYFHTRCLRIW